MKAIFCLLVSLSALSTLTHAEQINAYEQPSKPRRSLRSAAVVGGSSVSSGYDYIALVRLDGNTTSACTGSLIAPTKVLTAGHCCFNKATGAAQKASVYTVLLGAYDLKEDKFEDLATLRKEGKAVRNVSAVAYPSQYTGQTDSPYDVCVMTLSTSVTTITPVTIAAASNAKNVNVTVGSTVRVIGWGKQSDDNVPASELQYVDITTGTCPAQQATGYICYLKTNGGQCQGDSGGPILAKPSGSTDYAIYGTVSFGTGGARCVQTSSITEFDILTGTPAILKFIQSA